MRALLLLATLLLSAASEAHSGLAIVASDNVALRSAPKSSAQSHASPARATRQ